MISEGTRKEEVGRKSVGSSISCWNRKIKSDWSQTFKIVIVVFPPTATTSIKVFCYWYKIQFGLIYNINHALKTTKNWPNLPSAWLKNFVFIVNFTNTYSDRQIIWMIFTGNVSLLQIHTLPCLMFLGWLARINL